jgi:hypothetical protein
VLTSCPPCPRKERLTFVSRAEQAAFLVNFREEVGTLLSGGARNVAPDLLSDTSILEVVHLIPVASGLPPFHALVGGIPPLL